MSDTEIMPTPPPNVDALLIDGIACWRPSIDCLNVHRVPGGCHLVAVRDGREILRWPLDAASSRHLAELLVAAADAAPGSEAMR